MATFQIVGTWSGPANPAGDYTRTCHVETMRDNNSRNEDFLDRVRELGHIVFTDNTTLFLTVVNVSGVHHSKRHKNKNGYGPLIRKCIKNETRFVAYLPTGV